MNYNYYKLFVKDVEQVPRKTKVALVKVLQDIEAAIQISDIPNLQKLAGFKKAYSIKIDNYRLGLYKENEKLLLARLLEDDKPSDQVLPETETSPIDTKKISSPTPSTKKRAPTKVSGQTTAKKVSNQSKPKVD